MRIITSTDLSGEQEDILFDAPLKDIVLIIGPPGSGKTVMAFLRAQALTKRFKIVSLLMYNNPSFGISGKHIQTNKVASTHQNIYFNFKYSVLNYKGWYWFNNEHRY